MDKDRLDSFKITPEVHFGPSWYGLKQEAEKKRQHYAKHPSTRPRGINHELRGIVGEEAVARTLGLKRHGLFRDGGEDFYKTDVKSVPPKKPCLAIDVKTKRGKNTYLAAEYYVVVAVDLYQKWATILGWTTRDAIYGAPVEDLGHGDSYIVMPWELTPGLPEELVEYARVFKETQEES